ncbi:MAG: hypothetical protein HYR51_05625 [Candidatus Rokubacteria bacterium]|nr:hypothetical protein [Candidatus Rokubacteria bacterium]
MREVIVLALVFVAVAAPAAAQDAASLQNEIRELRRQLDAVNQQYQKAIDALTERLKRLESAPAPVTAAPPPSPATVPPTAPGATTPAGDRPVTAQDLVRPREPFSLTERRAPGQLLFDMGIVADFIGNLAGRDADKADRGTFAGRENRFFPREIEVNMYGRIDPYAQGVVRFEFAEEFDDGERALEVALAEAHFTLLTLPFGTRATLGLQPVRFGLLSHLHREALPQPDTPHVLLRFIGEEQFRESGAELAWIPPLPIYLEALVGIFNGDNETSFGRGSLFGSPLVTGRLRTFFETESLGALQIGVSGASGENEDRHRTTLAGVDLKYKLIPEGWRHPVFTIGAEGILSRRDTDDRDRTLDRFGWYTWAEIQPWKRWLGGVRYDWTELPLDPGREWAIEPYLGFLPSDFLRFRLAYKHTERSHHDAWVSNGVTARTVDELLLQATFFLGAHQGHPF